MKDLQEDGKTCYKAVCREAYLFANGLRRDRYIPFDNMENNLLSMKSNLARIGVDSRAVEISSLENIPKGDGFIAHVNKFGTGHFLFVKKKVHGGYLVYDPAHGNLILKDRELEADMTGRGLLISKAKKKTNLDPQPSVLDGKNKFLMILMMLIRCISAGVFLYTFNGVANPAIPYSMIAIFIGSVIFGFWMNSSMLKKHTLERTIPLTNKLCNKDAYAWCTGLISEEIRFYDGILNKLTFFFVSLVIVLNMDWVLSVFFLVSLVTGFTVKIFLGHFGTLRRNRLSYDEERILATKLSSSRFENLWNQSKVITSIECVSMLAVITTIISMLLIYMGINGLWSLDYLLSNLVFLGGSVFYLLKVFEDYDRKSVMRKYLYLLGKPLTDMLENNKKCYYYLESRTE